MLADRRHQSWNYFFAFFIPVLLSTAAFAAMGILPFGSKSLLIIDMNNQYTDFFSYFKTIFTQNNDFFYSFSLNLGGNFIGFSGYYLLSPFNFLFLLFSDENLPLAVTLVALLKIGACGFTFYYFLTKVYGGRTKLAILFSTAYALMAYNVVYLYNFLWLDVVAMTPIVILGIHKIFEEKKPYLYIAGLFLCFIFNYYITCMLCIFCAMYFIYRLVLSVDRLQDLKAKLRIIGLFAFSSVLAVGLACFLFLPVLNSLSGGKGSLDFSQLTFELNFNFLDIFTKLYTAPVNRNQIIRGLPNIFCGMVILVLLILFFFNERIPLKKKLVSAGFLFLFIPLFQINTFNVIWHGFQRPTWFPYRYSFFVSFLMIFLAYQCLLHRDGIRRRHLLYTGILFLVSTAILFRTSYDFISDKTLYLDIFIVLLTLPLLYCAGRYRHFGKIAVFCLTLLHFGNLFVNMYLSVNRQTPRESGEYSAFVSNMEPVTDKIKAADGGFYRMESTARRTFNDPMQYAYNGLSHYSSSEKQFTKDFIGFLGFRNNGNWAHYGTGTTAAADAFLGVKYLIADTDEIHKSYDCIFECNGKYVFRNPYALSPAFLSDEKVIENDVISENPFETQNNIFSAISSPDLGDIHTPADYEVVLNNMTAVPKGERTEYVRTDESGEASISYSVAIEKDQPLYVYMTAPYIQESEIFINGEPLGLYLDTVNWQILYLGSFQKGDIVNFTLKPKNNSVILDNQYFYYEDEALLARYCEGLPSISLDKISSSHLKGDFTVDADGKAVFLTIPYDEGWTIRVDGEAVNYQKAMDTFMSFSVPKGDHTIELRFVPKGFAAGVCITAVSLAALLGYCFVPRIRRKKVPTAVDI